MLELYWNILARLYPISRHESFDDNLYEEPDKTQPGLGASLHCPWAPHQWGATAPLNRSYGKAPYRIRQGLSASRMCNNSPILSKRVVSGEKK
jgi:hypothetical protein